MDARTKRLIKFRGTEDYAYVKNRPPKPASNNGGINWSSCRLMSPSGNGGGGGSTAWKNGIQYAFVVVRTQTQGRSPIREGFNSLGYGMATGATIAGVGEGALATGGALTTTTVGLGAFMVAAGLTWAIDATWATFTMGEGVHTVKFTRPCHTENTNAVQNGFEEPDFNEFQRQYAEYYGAK